MPNFLDEAHAAINSLNRQTNPVITDFLEALHSEIDEKVRMIRRKKAWYFGVGNIVSGIVLIILVTQFIKTEQALSAFCSKTNQTKGCSSSLDIPFGLELLGSSAAAVLFVATLIGLCSNSVEQVKIQVMNESLSEFSLELQNRAKALFAQLGNIPDAYTTFKSSVGKLQDFLLKKGNLNHEVKAVSPSRIPLRFFEGKQYQSCPSDDQKRFGDILLEVQPTSPAPG